MRRLWAPAILLLLVPGGVTAKGTGWEASDRILEQIGKDLPGDVHRYGWPRSDLHVAIGAISVEPALALGSWAAFQRVGAGGEAVAMGDLALLESELEPVLGALVAGKFEIMAIHNHLAGETPHVLYVHFHGHGEPAALAKTLREALAKTNTPVPARAEEKPTGEQEKIFERLQGALRRKGSMSGKVLQVGLPRAEAILEDGLEVPPSMGMSNAMNFQTAGTRIATTGDFVLIGGEVNPVLRELRAHGIQVTALHSHMLRETPRLFFMHFWGVGEPEDIGAGLAAALSKIATK